VDCDTAAIERLEAEKRRRQDEKVAKGEAVRVQFIPPVVRPDEVADAVIEKEKGRQIAELRERGETREIFFDDDPVTAIITGVPRCPDRGKDWAPLPPAKPYDRYAVASDDHPALRGAGRAPCGASHTGTDRAADRRRSGAR
jgi:hypothetical protein